MEDVLAIHRLPLDPDVPVVCFDESGKELRDLEVPAIDPDARGVRREDVRYVRCGSASILLTVAPLLGWRHIQILGQRTQVEWAAAMRALVDVHFPDADRIIVILDNLSTHAPHALYRCYPPAEAFRIARKLEFHFTPVRGSWLNPAENEFHALQVMSLAGQHFPTMAALDAHVQAWGAERNRARVTITYHFTPEEARKRMHRTYPIPIHDA